MRVLLVDDQPQSLMVLTDILKSHWPDIEIFRAVSGEMALAILSQHRLDLSLVDWQMPSMSGLTLLHTLQQDHAALPVILMSGIQVTHEDMRQALSSGAWDYLRKPFEPVEVVARVENVLRLSRAHLEIARLNETKDVVFQALSNHLVGGAQRMTLSMELIKRYLPTKTDYLERLLAESHANQQAHQALLQTLLTWSQQQFTAFTPRLQDFCLRPFLVQALQGRGIKLPLRVNDALWVTADTQVLYDLLIQLWELLAPVSLRSRLNEGTQQIEMLLPVQDGLKAQVLRDWRAHRLDPHASLDTLMLYLRLQSCQQQLKAMQGDLDLLDKGGAQETSLIIKLAGTLRA